MRVQFRHVHRESRRLFAVWVNKMLGTILIIVVVLLIVGAFPRWGYSRGWGYYPSGGLGLILVILIVLLLLGKL